MVKFGIERVAAREVIEDQGISRLQPGQPLVHLQAVLKSATLRVAVAKNLQGLDILWIAADDAFEEGDLGIKIANLSAVRLPTGCTAFFRHTTVWIISKRGKKVNLETTTRGKAEIGKAESRNPAGANNKETKARSCGLLQSRSGADGTITEGISHQTDEFQFANIERLLIIYCL
jgi:hypothetical protein